MNSEVEATLTAYGEVQIVPLSYVQKTAGKLLTRNWATIPHVTHHDEADITTLESARKDLAARASGMKLSLVPFIVKACVSALQTHPRLNASLDQGGANLILKRYFHIGLAIDTPLGLFVPVVRDCDRKDVVQIAAEIAALKQSALDRKLTSDQMSGGSFTVTSLGGLGGSAFTPIINAPEVAILGVAQAHWKPTLGTSDQLQWRLMLPLSLSYDHRAVNGADAARFVRSLAEALSTVRIL